MINAGTRLGHYEILSPIGAGGMGEVYLAEDTRLDRRVAVKVLPPAPVSDEQAKKRLLREAKSAATLDHPNICAIYEVGEENGLSFIVMQFVEGESLAARIERKPLDIHQALDIADQAAAALAAAHSRRIVHRDIKPQNIMIAGSGLVKMLDFGLAKRMYDRAIDGSEAETASLLTEAGMIIGTVPYMSPEQVRAESLDGRSDIFSFGVVLYEMLSGKRPFVARSAAGLISAILTLEPAPLQNQTGPMPAKLDRLVRRCLEKEPANRYQTMEELNAELKAVRQDLESGRFAATPTEATTLIAEAPVEGQTRWRGSRRSRVLLGLAGFVAVLAIAFLVNWSFFRSAPVALELEIKSLAVLPLKSLVRGTDDALELGMADTIITKISQIGALNVRPTSAVRKYASGDVDALEAARQLKVDAVLEGTLQRAGDRLGVNMNLLRARDGRSLWTDHFETRITDIFDIQDEVSRQVALQLRYTLTPTEQARLAKRYTSSPEAYEYYSRGMRSFDKRGNTVNSGEDVRAAIEFFKQAIGADKKYALAHTKLAFCYTWMTAFVETKNLEWLTQAENELIQAETLDPQLAEVHVVRHEILWGVNRGFQIEAAIKELLSAQQLNPSVGRTELGTLYYHMGLEEPALRELQRALDVDPTSEVTQGRYVEGLALLGKYDDSIAAYDRFNHPTDSRVSLAYMWRNQRDSAQREIEQGLARRPINPFALSTRALVWALEGKFREAEAEIPGIVEKSGGSRGYHHDAYNIASVYALEGNAKETVEWLRKTVAAGMPNYPLFARDPHLNRIRSDIGFVQFMAELKTRWEGYQREFK